MVTVYMTCRECHVDYKRASGDVTVLVQEQRVMSWCDKGHRMESDASEHMDVLIDSGARLIHHAAACQDDSVIDRQVDAFAEDLAKDHRIGGWLYRNIQRDPKLRRLR
jgi:hypothetical protein